jgi:hypothetical protein
MTSSRIQSRGTTRPASLEKEQQNVSTNGEPLRPGAGKEHAPGSLNDVYLVRDVIRSSMKSSGLSRAAIADRMSFLSGMRVTERMLHAFTAASKEVHRFPSELERAFCAAVGDDQLLICRAQLNGHVFIDAAEAGLLELGREYLRQKRASEKIARLEAGLQGVEL